MQKDSAPERSNPTSSCSSDSSSGSCSSSSYDSYDSSSDDEDISTQVNTQDKITSSDRPKRSHESASNGDPCYEDFMPGKESDRSFVPPPATAVPEPEKKPEDKGLTKEDLIDILSEALYRSAQKEKPIARQKRGKKTDNSSEEGGEEEEAEDITANPEDRENQKVLGSLASSVLNKKRKDLPLVRAGSSKKTTRTSNNKVSNLSWKKKLEAIKKAHLQLSSRVAALIELAE